MWVFRHFVKGDLASSVFCLSPVLPVCFQSWKQLYQSCSEAHQGWGGGSLSALFGGCVMNSYCPVMLRLCPTLETWFINTLYSVILSSIKGDYLLWKRVLQVSVFILIPENSSLWMLPGDCLQIMYNLDGGEEKHRELRCLGICWLFAEQSTKVVKSGKWFLRFNLYISFFFLGMQHSFNDLSKEYSNCNMLMLDLLCNI